MKKIALPPVIFVTFAGLLFGGMCRSSSRSRTDAISHSSTSPDA